MNAEEIKAVLDERRQSFEACGPEEALSEPVDAERFYRFASSISDITVSSSEVHVDFFEPVPGATDLDPGYKYTVSVGKGRVSEENGRCEMPRKDLITLQQISIVIWAMAMGLLGERNE